MSFLDLCLQERRSMVKNKTSDILPDTRKLQIRTGTNQDKSSPAPGMALPEPPNSAKHECSRTRRLNSRHLAT